MAEKKCSIPFPKPHAHIVIEKRTVSAGMHLYRIHPSVYAGNQFNNTAKGDARFSPIRDRKTKDIIATIYAGDTTEVAICEVLFHDVDVSQQMIVFEQSNLKNKSHTEIALDNDLIVAVIDPVSVVKMRAGKKLIHCDAQHYTETRLWAEHIHEQHSDIQGLAWPSRQHEGKSYVFFEDRINSGILGVIKTDTIANDKSTREKIVRIADRMNITIR